MYVQVDELLRQLRMRNREHREGQQQAFYTIQELKDIFKKPLHQIHCTEDNFIAALKFINEVRMYVTVWLVGGIIIFHVPYVCIKVLSMK